MTTAALWGFSWHIMRARKYTGILGYKQEKPIYKSEPLYQNGLLRGASRIVYYGMPSLLLVGVIGYFGWRAMPSRQTIVLVADFVDPDGKDVNRVTRDVVEPLKETLADYYPAIQVKRLNRPILDNDGQGSERARTIGARPWNKATIVIWGDYVLEPELELYVHFDYLRGQELQLDVEPLLATERERVYGELHVQQVVMAQPAVELPEMVMFKTALGEHLGQLVALTAGLALFDAENYAEAIDLFDRAAEGYGDSLNHEIEQVIRYYRAATYLELNQVEAALREVTPLAQSVENSAPNEPISRRNVLFLRGFIFLEQGEYESARDDYTQVIALDPEDALAYNNRGIAYLEMGEYAAAIDDYTQAIILDPEYAIAYNNRGVAYRNMGEYAAAIDDYTQAIILDPEDALAYNNRGNAYREMGEYAAAILDFRQFLTLRPDAPERAEVEQAIAELRSQLEE